jgi:hypothetical protein
VTLLLLAGAVIGIAALTIIVMIGLSLARSAHRCARGSLRHLCIGGFAGLVLALLSTQP